MSSFYLLLYCVTHFLAIQTISAQCPFALHTRQTRSLRSGIEFGFLSRHEFERISSSPNSIQRSKPSKLLKCAIPPTTCNNSDYYYRSFDGSCNNLENPGFGMANSRLTRLLKPNYGDDVYTPSLSTLGGPLPNARYISLTVYGDQTVPDTLRTMALLQWGQFLAHETSQLSVIGTPNDCCKNADNKQCFPIRLNHLDPIATDKQCLSFARSTADVDTECDRSGLPYAEKLNRVTSYLDLGSLYGNSKEANQKFRANVGGLLKSSFVNSREWMPISQNQKGECGGPENHHCFTLPDMRNQFIPGSAIMHTILLREHNHIANIIASLNPYYSDEQIFQEARKINIAQYQQITYYEWLPLIVGKDFAIANNLIYQLERPTDYVNDYDVTINAATYASFSSSAYRYAHNQIPGYFSLITEHGFNTTLQLKNYFGRPETVSLLSDGDNFDSLIRGLLMQPQKRADSNIDEGIKYYFNRKIHEEYGSDLKAIDIQRARDFGMPSYNDMRVFCGLPRACDWNGFLQEISEEKLERLSRVYATPDDVELTVAGALETHISGSMLGPTFKCIIGKQFSKLRKADRFFFEHENILSGFTKLQLAEIRKASLARLICNNADRINAIQRNAFILPGFGNEPISCADIPQLDFTKWTSYRSTYK